MTEIIFAGGSHYGLMGYKSLWKYFDKIYLISENPEDIIENMRPEDLIIDTFDSVQCKYVFLCGYPKFITKDQLERKEYINIHGALLPKYRGMHSTFYAIMNGESKLGITFHLVDEYMDSGSIISQYSFDYVGQIIKDINLKIDDLVYEHAGHTIYEYISGNIIPQKQDEEEATFGAKRNLDDCLIDFSMPNYLLRRFFSALTPTYPYPLLCIRNECYEVLPKSEIIDREYYGPKGRVVFVNERGTWIKTEEGFLVVKRVRNYVSREEYDLSDLVPIGYRFLNKSYDK